MSLSPYEVLGVAASVSDDELRKAFRKALRETHPDTGGDPKRFTAVQLAWERIGSPEKRAAYDAGRSTRGDHPTFTAQPARPRQDTRPKPRSYGHPGGWRRERFLSQMREWVGRGVTLDDPYDPALVRTAPREIRHTLADALAEEATARTLSTLGIGYTVWHDVATGAPEDKIDHIVLGPTGFRYDRILVYPFDDAWDTLTDLSVERVEAVRKRDADLVVAVVRERRAVLQAMAIANGLQATPGLVLNPGPVFILSTVSTLTGGTMLLTWLGEQVTNRGIGNGVSLIIFAGIVAGLPRGVSQMIAMVRTGALSSTAVALILALAVGVILVIVFMERSQRRLLTQYPRRAQGGQAFGGETSFLPLKINTANVIPPIFASSLLLLPLTISQFAGKMPPLSLRKADEEAGASNIDGITGATVTSQAVVDAVNEAFEQLGK